MHKNNKVALHFLLTTTALTACGFAQASIVDRPLFTISGVVIVWGGDGSGSASVGDFIVNSASSGSIDLINASVQPVITGTLTNALASPSSNLSVSGQTLNDQGVVGELDVGDSYSTFSPNEEVTTSLGKFQSSFYVASNTAFTIRAQATLDTTASSLGASLSDVYRTLVIERFGTDGGLSYGLSSQFPHSGNTSTSGVLNNGFLNALSSETLVFQGDRSTAIGSGSIADQSVRFTNTYEIAAGGFEVDKSSLVANVVYTVAIP